MIKLSFCLRRLPHPSAAGEAGRAAGRELLEDERRFIDLENSPLWFNRARPIGEK